MTYEFHLVANVMPLLVAAERKAATEKDSDA
jgi:hypothetical protein